MSETKDVRALAGISLAAEVLASGATVQVRALGSSMLPAVWPGDVLTIEGSSAIAPVPGDIVLALRNQQPCIHRVKEVLNCDGRILWVTRGDAVPQSDPPVEASDLLGKVSCIHRNRRRIVPRRKPLPGSRLFAWMLCRWDRLRSVCLHMHSFRQSFGQQT